MTDFSSRSPDRSEPNINQSLSRQLTSSSPPPHPLDGEWHVYVNDQTYGPYTGHQIAEFVKEGRVVSTTQVLAVGSENWTVACRDRYLVALFKPSSLQGPPPITAAAGATVVQVTNHVAQPALLMDEAGAIGPKSAGTALLLSFFICGAGQMYCGKVGKGILMLVGCIVLWFVFLGWIIAIWSMIDAYTTAKNMNLRYMQRLNPGRLS